MPAEVKLTVFALSGCNRTDLLLAFEALVFFGHVRSKVIQQLLPVLLFIGLLLFLFFFRLILLNLGLLYQLSFGSFFFLAFLGFLITFRALFPDQFLHVLGCFLDFILLLLCFFVLLFLTLLHLFYLLFRLLNHRWSDCDLFLVFARDMAVPQLFSHLMHDLPLVCCQVMQLLCFFEVNQLY